jgi:hypothetical protein
MHMYIYIHKRIYINRLVVTSSTGGQVGGLVIPTTCIGISLFYYLYVDSFTSAFGWSPFLCRIRFCDTLVVIFLK